MSDFLNEVMADCAEAETDLGGKTLVWNSLTYPCAPTLLRRGTMLVVGGSEVEIKLTLRVRWSGTTSTGRTWEFSADEMPRSKQRVNYGGKVYRILQVNDAHQTFIEIDLGDVNR